jgi:hypothetical protein
VPPSHGGSRRFESCCAHQLRLNNQSLRSWEPDSERKRSQSILKIAYPGAALGRGIGAPTPPMGFDRQCGEPTLSLLEAKSRMGYTHVFLWAYPYRREGIELAVSVAKVRRARISEMRLVYLLVLARCCELEDHSTGYGLIRSKMAPTVSLSLIVTVHELVLFGTAGTQLADHPSNFEPELGIA